MLLIVSQVLSTLVGMANAEDVIPITKENIKAVFPRLKWVDVDYEHGVYACGRFAQNGI